MGHRERTRAEYRARIHAALTHVEDHLDEPLEPKDLARIACLSPHHFHRVFKGQTGETVMGCLRRLRLERAGRQLRRTEAKVIDVALEAGYASHEAFTRAFAAHFGAPPTDWRKSPGPRLCALPAPEVPRGDAELRNLGKFSFAYLRHRGSYAQVPEAWRALWVRRAAEGRPASVQMVGRYWDDPDVTPPDKHRYDVGWRLEEQEAPPVGYGVDTLGPGRWAVMVHVGPYETLGETYLDLVGRWLPAAGILPAEGPCIEIYLDDPREVSTDQLRTEVWAPIAPRT